MRSVIVPTPTFHHLLENDRRRSCCSVRSLRPIIVTHGVAAILQETTSFADGKPDQTLSLSLHVPAEGFTHRAIAGPRTISFVGRSMAYFGGWHASQLSMIIVSPSVKIFGFILSNALLPAPATGVVLDSTPCVIKQRSIGITGVSSVEIITTP